MVTKWFTPDTLENPAGVVLVVHGLNLNPERMKGIISVLNEMNLEVLLLSLQGHGKNFDKQIGKNDSKARLNAFKKVTYDRWKAETQLGYENTLKRAKQLNCPVYFVGYSLGGLMGCDLLLYKQQMSFNKMVLFAPAIATHRFRVPFFKLLKLFPGIVIPSLSPEKYRSNHGTPIAAYLSLLDALRHFKSNLNGVLNIPTVVFIDKNDELVSYQKLKSQVKKHGLEQWSIYKFERNPHQLKYPFHHLIIDEKSAGTKEWSIIKNKMAHHFSR